jgi:glycosyltransferase involved in cell wall biosynthesis
MVICNSEVTRKHVVELCGVPASRAVTVYYGSDADRFRPATASERAALRHRFGWDQNRPVVLFIGALGDRRKGFDTLFEAWARLCKAKDWDAFLVVIGSGGERQVWERVAACAGLANRIQFLGFRTDVPDLLRAADALISPTRYEAYGLGVHEALCCGLPAFVSASAGVAERYPPELADLLLPDPNDASDLAHRLQRWREDAIQWRSRMAPFAETLRSFTWDDMARIYLKEIEA